jgi:hypothetical protein
LKLDLFVRKIVRSLECQIAKHGLSRKGRATAFARKNSRRNAINLAPQCGNVQHLNNLDRRITQVINFRGPRLSRKQTTFDCPAWPAL